RGGGRREAGGTAGRAARRSGAGGGPPGLPRWGRGWGGLPPPVFGSGEHTSGTPSRIGIPSTPGYVPKYESNERFSCMITTTWRILSIPVAADAAGDFERAASTVPAESAIPAPSAIASNDDAASGSTERLPSLLMPRRATARPPGVLRPSPRRGRYEQNGQTPPAAESMHGKLSQQSGRGDRLHQSAAASGHGHVD